MYKDQNVMIEGITLILLRDPNIHPNDFTSIDDAAVYIGSMNERDTGDWPTFESYLRNRLIFKSTKG
jgi:hypothetical protein